MNGLYFIGFALVAAFLAALIKRFEPTVAAFLSLGACVMLMISAAEPIGAIVSSVQQAAQQTALHTAYIALLLRIVGISYAAQIGAQACRDAGSAGIAEHVELCARVVILSICTPLFLSLLEMITEALG